jgi:hypothetical protein
VALTTESDGAPAEDKETGGAARRSGALRLVRPIALALFAGALIGRYLVPNLAGLVVGFDRAARPIEIVAGVLSQSLAMITEVSAIALLLAVAAARLRAPLRLAAIGLGGFVVLVSFSAARDRVPAFAALPVGLAAAIVAFGGALASRSAPMAQPAARAVGVLSVSSIVRLAAVVVATMAPSGPAGAGAFGTAARVLATASLALDAIAIVLAMSFSTRRARALFDPATIVALALSLVATRLALGGEQEDAGAASVLFHRIAAGLLPHPHPYAPPALALFVAFLAPIIAGALLVRRGPVPALGGAVALALLARGAPEVPLAALGLLTSGLALALLGADPAAIWTALGSERRSSS